MCAISDRSGILGLGGIIGGTRSGTELSTKNILLESAYFFPSSTRKILKSHWIYNYKLRNKKNFNITRLFFKNKWKENKSSSTYLETRP